MVNKAIVNALNPVYSTDQSINNMMMYLYNYGHIILQQTQSNVGL